MYQIAGVVVLLRTILFIVLIYYALRFISRLVLPFVFKSFFKRAQNFNQQGGKGREKQAKQSKKKDSNLGEYVEFEEIKDKKEK